MNRPGGVQSILVMDEDPGDLAATCWTLGAQYPVLATASGDAALRAVRLARPAAIVLDVMLAEGKNGFTVFRELQNDPATCEIPVIFLTNVNRVTGLPFGSDEIEKYLGGKPAAFLEKPLSADELLSCVENLLKSDGSKG